MPDMFSDSRLSCANPFQWLEIHEGGQCFLCCPAWLKTSVGNLLEHSLEQIWNGPCAQRLRKAVLNGTFAHCNKKRCPRLHTRTYPVGPPGHFSDQDIAEALAGNNPLPGFGPKILNLCYDHSCNLYCPSCRTHPFVARGESAALIETLGERLRVQAGPSAEQLRISGTSDPFGSPHFLRMLRSFDPEAWPRLCSIHLHSNGQLWTPGMWQVLAAIHPLVKTAEISVDAAGAHTYSLNRPGGSFAQLMENLEFISTLPLRGKLSFVVQRNNFREVPAFAALGQRLGFEVYFSQLVNWGTFSREEFRERAVHHPDHPDHSLLLQNLNLVAGSPGVDLGNLMPLVAGAR